MAGKRKRPPSLENTTIGICSIALTLDTRYKSRDNKHHASIRYTINGERFYYHLGESFSVDEFNTICKSDGRGRGGNKSNSFITKNRLCGIFESHVDIIRDMAYKGTLKSIANVKAILNGKISSYGKADNHRDVQNFISVWNEIIKTKKVSTASAYRNARDCFMKSGVYHEKEGFAVDINKINAWVLFMKKKEYTSTTIGIYLRAIRIVFKTCISKGFIREADYPFGTNQAEKIRIPVGNSRKSSYLNVEQMTQLYLFFLNGNYPKNMKAPYLLRQSLGVFLCQYLCNGCNLYDLALLRYDDYYELSSKRAFRFYRHKTTEHSESGSEVLVPITPPLQRIIDDIGQSWGRGNLVFPFLLGEDYPVNSKAARDKIHQENKNVSVRMKKIVKILEWEVFPSGTYARHSFATNLSQREVPLDYISFAMGHSVGNRGQITKRYISPYPIEKQMEYNSYLLDIPEMIQLREQSSKFISDDDLLAMLKKRFGTEKLRKLIEEK